MADCREAVELDFVDAISEASALTNASGMMASDT